MLSHFRTLYESVGV